MEMSSLLALAGWVWIGWVVYTYLKKKGSGKPPGAAPVAMVANEASLDRGINTTTHGAAPGWLRQFSLLPSRVVDLVRVDKACYTLAEASSDVRMIALQCWEAGRCRSLEFARFMVGEALAEDARLYFAKVYDGESEAKWYAFVAPANWWRGVVIESSLLSR